MNGKSAIELQIERLEREVAEVRAKLTAPPLDANVTVEGIWAGMGEVSDDDLEEITHPQRVIERLKRENAELRSEVERYRGTEMPDTRPQA